MDGRHGPSGPHRIRLIVRLVRPAVPPRRRCRIAWTLASASEDDGGDSYGLGPDDVVLIRELLSPVEVWAPEDVDRSLGLDP